MVWIMVSIAQKIEEKRWIETRQNVDATNNEMQLASIRQIIIIEFVNFRVFFESVAILWIY